MAQLEKRYEEYLRDESRLTGYAESILQAKSAQEVLDFLKTESPFTVQGARTGIVGGAVPQGGRILNLSSMNRITGLSVKDGAFFVTVEPGVLLCDLDDALASKRFDASSWDEASREALAALAKAPPQFFPPDPTESTATLGGMFAANARGICAYRYGCTADYVQAVTVALADGRVWTIERGQYVFDESGCPLPDGALSLNLPESAPLCSALQPRKGSDLIDLFAGSEGTLGVVLSLTLRLLPRPAIQWGVVFFLPGEEDALAFAGSVQELATGWSGPALCSLEFLGEAALETAAGLRAKQTRLQAIPEFPAGCRGAVLAELCASGEEEMEEALMSLLDAFAECGGEEEGTWAADSPAEIEKFRLLRHAVPEGINAAIDEVRQKEDSVTKLAADFSAPLDRREELIALYREGIQKSGLRGVYFGHIAENHLHVNLIPRDETQYKQGLALLSSWAGACASMGGCLAAENGVGKLKRNLLDQNLPQEQKALMAAIKAYFDPRGLLCPGNLI